MTTLALNGQRLTLNTDTDTPLLWVVLEEFGLTGTNFGCGKALCGACTVHLDGQAVHGCITPLSAAAGKKVQTIEAMEGDKVGKAAQDAWVKHDVAQCGDCQSGQVMTATALIEKKRKPIDADIDGAMAGNICRCSTCQRIRPAIHDAAASLA